MTEKTEEVLDEDADLPVDLAVGRLDLEYLEATAAHCTGGSRAHAGERRARECSAAA